MAAPARNYNPAIRHGSKWMPSDILGGAGSFGFTDDHYLVTAKDSTDVYYTWLTENGISDGDIYTTIPAAHTAMTDAHNDVLFVMPGVHSETAVVSLTKDKISLVGVGGPVSFNGSTGTNRIRVATAGAASLFNISGHYTSFYNLHTTSGANSTSTLGDIVISGGAQNFYAQDCALAGGGNSTQTGNALAGCPVIFDGDETCSGHYAKFVNCRIGSSGNSTRTTGAGAVRYNAGGSVQHTEFENCVFAMRSETSGSTHPKLIHLAGNFAVDRYIWFKNCMFYNFVENHSVTMDYAIHNECGTTHDIILQDCSLIGVDAWSDTVSSVKGVWTNKANAASDGGKAIAVDTGA